MISSKKLGFIQSPYDSRDVIFSASLDSAIPEEYKLKNVQSVIDQGDDPICAAISLSEIINWQKFVRSDDNKVSYWDIFDLRADKNMEGMIPRQALSQLKKVGVGGYKIKSYAKIESIEAAKSAIMLNGPILLGLNAYNQSEFWKNNGQYIGGHAVIFTGWDKNGFILQNSWGVEWENGGTAIFGFEYWKDVVEAWTIMI